MMTIQLTVLTLVLVAAMQFIFNRYFENQRNLKNQRSNAYKDYLKCVCEQAHFRPIFGSREYKEIFSRLGDAKARICLYGSKNAVTAFSQFEELGATLASGKQRGAFAKMISIMRIDAGSELPESQMDLKNILIGPNGYQL